MAKQGGASQKRKTDTVKSAQRKRTHKSKQKKYKALILKFPTHPHIKTWEEKFNHSASIV